MDQAVAFAPYVAERLKALNAQAQPLLHWAERNKPRTAAGWLAVAAASSLITAVLASGLVAFIALAWCTAAALVAASFVVGLVVGGWLCLTAWLALASSIVIGSAAAWLFVAQLGMRVAMNTIHNLLPKTIPSQTHIPANRPTARPANAPARQPTIPTEPHPSPSLAPSMAQETVVRQIQCQPVTTSAATAPSHLHGDVPRANGGAPLDHSAALTSSGGCRQVQQLQPNGRLPVGCRGSCDGGEGSKSSDCGEGSGVGQGTLIGTADDTAADVDLRELPGAVSPLSGTALATVTLSVGASEAAGGQGKVRGEAV